MISAERFAQVAGSYWKLQFPRLESFVRIANMSAEQCADPVKLNSEHERHAVLSEAAFVLWKSKHSAQSLDPLQAFAMASSRLSVIWDQADFSNTLLPAEEVELLALAANLDSFEITEGFDSIEIEPRLPGCGVVAGGTPDFRFSRPTSSEVSKRGLGEVKTVDRTFRSVDYRQLISYVVLSYSSTHEILDELQLINPLRGTTVSFDVDDFFWLTRSQAADEACAEIAYEWADPGVSP
ncbi:hypothetical protein [Luteipulveratus flavus]|uniref:PD-(D/E)XK endonuclease-like domain-containing protein n=1 Tax=Luteipulveratus flavus TaxID=3031728 RepID=A0ABT6C2J7_9MICO|nr:hypothetical protein [Luteipulveratus sp. YIM 133296]MDF8262866.1 hypothetical protein [Luteipulveratus sp. YIM 133296]